MNRTLRLEHHLRVEAAGVELAFLLGGPEPILLRGRLFALVAPLLDGRRTVAEIIAALAGQVSAAEVYFALGRLEREGHVVEGGPEPEPERAGFWEALGLDARRAAERLAATTVTARTLEKGGIELCIADDGHGASEDELLRGGMHRGVDAMRERAWGVGGTMTFEETSGGGCTVRVIVPPRPAVELPAAVDQHLRAA